MAKRELQEVNAGSMADIAFLLLVFFLMTTTMATDTGISTLLPQPVPEDEEPPPPVHERNVFVVLLNSNNQLLVDGQYMAVKDLKEATKEFIENKANDVNKPAKDEKEIEFFGVYPVSKAVISLQNDRGTEYQAYISVQNELHAAYHELRDQVAKSKWNKTYNDLDDEQKKAVKAIYPQRISEAEPKNIN